MKIGIDASRANKAKKTGVEWYSWHLIQAMKKIQTDQDVQFVLYSREPLRGELAELPQNWESRVLSWPTKFWTQVRFSYEMVISPPDVLFIPSHIFPIIHPKKTVMTVHDIAAASFPESYNWFSRWYTLWSAKYAVKNLWKVIVPSEFVKKDLVNFTGSRSDERKFVKIRVIPHGYDKRYKIIEDQQKIEQILEKHQIKKPFILNIGRLGKKKNSKKLTESFNLVNNEADLVIVGGRDEGYEEVLQEIEKSPKKEKIKIIDHIDAADLPFIMNAAEVFVFPSKQEGFGLPVLEAMACGTPVVAAKGSSLEEVGGNACEYVDPEDVDSIKEGIEKLLNSSQIREQNIELGLNRVERYSWHESASGTMSLLLEG